MSANDLRGYLLFSRVQDVFVAARAHGPVIRALFLRLCACKVGRCVQACQLPCRFVDEVATKLVYFIWSANFVGGLCCRAFEVALGGFGLAVHVRLVLRVAQARALPVRTWIVCLLQSGEEKKKKEGKVLQNKPCFFYFQNVSIVQPEHLNRFLHLSSLLFSSVRNTACWRLADSTVAGV